MGKGTNQATKEVAPPQLPRHDFVEANEGGVQATTANLDVSLFSSNTIENRA